MLLVSLTCSLSAEVAVVGKEAQVVVVQAAISP